MDEKRRWGVSADTYHGGVPIELAGTDGSVAFHIESSDVPAGYRCSLVVLTLGPLVAEVRTAVLLDLDGLRRDLTTLMGDPTLTGSTHIGSAEGTFVLDLRVAHGRGTIQIHVEPELRSDAHLDANIATDQTFVAPAVRSIEEARRSLGM